LRRIPNRSAVICASWAAQSPGYVFDVVWSLESGLRIATLVRHQGVVWRVAVSEHARMIASGSGDNTVRLWDLRCGDLLDELSYPDCVAAVSFDPTGERLVVGCDDAHVYVYDVAPRE
jgi:WD40 repeat protein